MHPEILRELTSQRGREMRDRAHQSMLVHLARRVRRRGQADQEEYAGPAIPDYVDGSFRPAGDRVPSAGRAA